MAEYMEDSAAVIRNLEDAGCGKRIVEQFMKLGKTGERQGQLSLLEKHRRNLLEKVHKSEKQIDCLDFLVFQMTRGIKKK